MTDMEQRAIDALARTWQAVGYDYLQTFVDCGEAESIDAVVMTREDVIDAVTTCGFVGGYPEMHGSDKEAVQWLDKQSEKVKDQLLQKAFPHDRYGT